MVVNYGVKPHNPPDSPLICHLQHTGHMYCGNPCFHPANIKSTGEMLNALYPEHSIYFWRYAAAPRTRPIYQPSELSPYAPLHLSICALNRIVLAERIVNDANTPPYIAFIAYKFILTHVIHVENPNNAPQERANWDIGILPTIPLHYTWLLTNNGDDTYNGERIETYGMYGNLIHQLFNKNLRLVWTKREGAKMCATFVGWYPHTWFYFVDMMLLCTFLGVYYPHDYYTRPFYLSLPVATVVCLWMRRIAYHYHEEWLLKNYNLIMFACCIYLYDQTDHNTPLRRVMCEHYGHHEYMVSLKLYANSIRHLIETRLAPHAIDMIRSWNKPTRELCVVWNKLLLDVNESINVWYNATMSPKYIATPNYFSTCIETFSAFLPKNYIYNIPKPVHECIVECAVITAEQCLTIPMFYLFFAFSFEPQFFDTIITILHKCIENHDSIAELLSMFLKFIQPYPKELSIIIEYCMLCIKLCALRAVPSTSHLRHMQRCAIENRAGTMIVLPEIANVLFCTGCVEPKVSIANSNRGNNGPFRSLQNAKIPSLTVPSSRLLDNPSDRIGPPKKDKGIIFSIDLQGPICSTPLRLASDQMRQYQHVARTLESVDLTSQFVRFNRWIGECAACGCNAVVHKRNQINGYFYCDNHIDTNVQFVMHAFANNPSRSRKPHLICGWGICYDKPVDRSNIILDQFGQLIVLPLCTFHATDAKLTSIICDFERKQCEIIQKSALNPHMLTGRYKKKIEQVSLIEPTMKCLEN